MPHFRLPEIHNSGILSAMKRTFEIPDDLYRQAKVHAAQERREMNDLVREGLRLVLGLSKKASSRQPCRMKAPVTIRKDNVIPALSNDAMAKLLERSGGQMP